ncbi:hypothetical protein B5566_02335 [Mycobacterium sp. MHSD3]|nr:hypothetical protein B5566_02335 [Mycobacterium sp. MHSD3]
MKRAVKMTDQRYISPVSYAGEYDAYGRPPVEDYPAAAAPAPAPGAIRYVWAAAALLGAAAALVAATAYGFRAASSSAAPAPAAATVTATVTLPPPDRNAAFLADLDSAGINYFGDRQTAIHNAYVACVWLGTGKAEADVVAQMGSSTKSAGMSPDQLAQFVKLATANYCPGGHL